MSNFSSLKSNSGKKSLEHLTAELSKISDSKTKKGSDDRFWSPTVDKVGVGSALIRFLPACEGEEVPFVRLFDHGFKGPTGLWYIENSLTTLGKPDPVSAVNSKLWNSVDSDDAPERKQARAQKRRLHYISNIYVISDPGNPSNEGKVMLFKYGKKIFDKLNEAMNPQFKDEKAFNPFDLWSGAAFKLKIRQVEGYRNYDKSEFSNSEPLFDDDKKLEEVWKLQHKLTPFLDPSNFKDYNELNEKLMKVLDAKGSPMKRAEQRDLEEVSEPVRSKTVSSPKMASVEDDEDDDSLEFFKKLASK